MLELQLFTVVSVIFFLRRSVARTILGCPRSVTVGFSSVQMRWKWWHCEHGFTSV